MNALSKVLLTVSAVSFAASLTGPGIEVWYGTLKPVSALLFIVAFIVHIVAGLDPEQYGADQRLREELMRNDEPAPVVPLTAAVKAAA